MIPFKKFGRGEAAFGFSAIQDWKKGEKSWEEGVSFFCFGVTKLLRKKGRIEKALREFGVLTLSRDTESCLQKRERQKDQRRVGYLPILKRT